MKAMSVGQDPNRHLSKSLAPKTTVEILKAGLCRQTKHDREILRKQFLGCCLRLGSIS